MSQIVDDFGEELTRLEFQGAASVIQKNEDISDVVDVLFHWFVEYDYVVQIN